MAHTPADDMAAALKAILAGAVPSTYPVAPPQARPDGAQPHTRIQGGQRPGPDSDPNLGLGLGPAGPNPPQIPVYRDPYFGPHFRNPPSPNRQVEPMTPEEYDARVRARAMELGIGPMPMQDVRRFDTRQSNVYPQQPLYPMGMNTGQGQPRGNGMPQQRVPMPPQPPAGVQARDGANNRLPPQQWQANGGPNPSYYGHIFPPVPPQGQLFASNVQVQGQAQVAEGQEQRQPPPGFVLMQRPQPQQPMTYKQAYAPESAPAPVMPQPRQVTDVPPELIRQQQQPVPVEHTRSPLEQPYSPPTTAEKVPEHSRPDGSTAKNVQAYEDILTQQTWELYATHALSAADVLQRYHLCQRVEGWFKASLDSDFSNGELHMFGSSINGFGSKTSDMDVTYCISLDNVPLPDHVHALLAREPEPEDQGQGSEPQTGDNTPDVSRSPVRSRAGSRAAWNKWRETEVEHAKEVFVVHKIEQVLRALAVQGKVTHIECTLSCKVPVAKFVDVESGVHVDITINNYLPLFNSLLLRTYCALDPRVAPLGFAIKYWAKQRDINDPTRRTLSSYGYVIMVLFFLMTRGPVVVPCLQQIRSRADLRNIHAPQAEPINKPKKPADVTYTPGTPHDETRLALEDMSEGAWIHHKNGLYNVYYAGLSELGACVRGTIAFCEKIRSAASRHAANGNGAEGVALPPISVAGFRSNNNSSLGSLVRGFFRYYAYTLHHDDIVVSVRKGHALEKEDKHWESAYYLCIEDPFVLTHNLVRVLDVQMQRLLQRELMRSFKLLYPLDKNGPVKYADFYTCVCEEVHQGHEAGAMARARGLDWVCETQGCGTTNMASQDTCVLCKTKRKVEQIKVSDDPVPTPVTGVCVSEQPKTSCVSEPEPEPNSVTAEVLPPAPMKKEVQVAKKKTKAGLVVWTPPI